MNKPKTPPQKTKNTRRVKTLVRHFTPRELNFAVARYAMNEPSFIAQFGEGTHNVNISWLVKGDAPLEGADVFLYIQEIVEEEPEAEAAPEAEPEETPEKPLLKAARENTLAGKQIDDADGT